MNKRSALPLSKFRLSHGVPMWGADIPPVGDFIITEGYVFRAFGWQREVEPSGNLFPCM